MSVIMMNALEIQVKSLSRQVEYLVSEHDRLAKENDQVRNLLAEYDKRHDSMVAALTEVRDMNPSVTALMQDGSWRCAHRDLQRIARLALSAQNI